MISIIKQFNAHNLKYTFDSSTTDNEFEKEYGISKDKTFYSEYNSPSYWQISFPIPVTAESYQFRPYRSTGNHVPSWNVSFSNGDSQEFLQTNSLSSKPSGAAKFSFQKPISFRSFRITTSNIFLSVGEFDLFGTTRIASINYGLRRQKNNKKHNHSDDATNNLLNKKSYEWFNCSIKIMKK